MINIILKILISFLFITSVFAQSYEAQVPLYDGEDFLGDIYANIENEQLIWIDKASLLSVLENRIDAKTLSQIKLKPTKINKHDLPIQISFNPQEFKAQTKIDLTLRERQNTDLGINLDEEKKYALYPAPFGGAINYRLEQFWIPDSQGKDYFSAQFNSFLNFHSFVFENQTYYQDNIDQKWYRGDTRIVKDFEKENIRLQLGDVYPEVQGFMSPVPMGGISIHRNFSINPYRLPYPGGNQSFTLKARSFVKYYVNSVLVKSEYLPPGNYAAVDIPLNNGLNSILIEAEDDLGGKQVFIFRSSSNISLLNKGESKFDLSYGVAFEDSNYKRDYQEKDGQIFSGFYQYGIDSTFSASGYLQTRRDLNLYGSELINALPFGNVTLGHGRSDFKSKHGSASSLGYQLMTQGQRWFDSHTLLLRYENREDKFRTSPNDFFTEVQNLYSANYTIPLNDFMTFSLGGNYGDIRDNSLSDKYGYDGNISFRILNRHNLTLYLSRNRDAYKKWNDTAYAFLTIMIPESNSYLSALYDQKNNSTRLNALYDNQGVLYRPRVQGSIENYEKSQVGELDMSVPTQVGDFGGRVGARNENSKTSPQGSLRFNSAYVFAFSDGEFAQGISRPVPGSFVIFKPEERLRDQKIGLKSSSPYTESQSGLFDEVVFTNLIPYQFRDIQLDPTFLDDGRTLGKEKFMLYPRYKSAHLIKLEERGSVIISGRILDYKGSPYSLQVGTVSGIPFFTNRDGELFIEGLEAGRHSLKFDNSSDTYSFSVTKDERGMKDIGIIQLKDNE